jgi:hypothetical protein
VFSVFEDVFLEVTDFGRRFTTVTCTHCNHTSWFAKEPPNGEIVRVADSPYR